MITLLLLFVFSDRVSADCDPCPRCYRPDNNPGCGCIYACYSSECLTCDEENNTCVTSCLTSQCQTCDSNGNCVSSCDSSQCLTCDGNGNCVVCGGDPNQACCNGQCYDIRTKQCCHDATNDYICDINCKSCCNGSCCNSTNCEICKNNTSCIVAQPTNMQQTYVEDQEGTLYFLYKWDSTTGDTNDLDNSLVREKVDYPGGSDPYHWPSPPWDCDTSNPTLLPVPPIPGTDAELQDHHYPCDLPGPYQAASFTATQVYQYMCTPCGNWETLLSIGPITRYVSSPGSDLWRYSITKSGAYAEIFPLP